MLAVLNPPTVTQAQPGPPVCTGLEAGPQRTVTRIVDGETVALDDGTELRLIGALAPRATDVGAEPGLWPMEVAAQEELRGVVLGKSIELAFGGERLDRYGRLKAHAFWVEGDRRRWVQGHLLEQGLARAYTLAGNRSCAGELLAAERIARDGRRGLWTEAAYQIRLADQPLELLRYRATFQLVEGRLVRVAPLRGVIYLNFGVDWRGGFAATLHRGDIAVLGASAAATPKVLEGKTVRVRGWLEQRNGPVIDLSTAGPIEVVDDARSPGDAQGARPRWRRGDP